jgi:hypothetical protein
MAALLPIRIENRNIPQKRQDEQWQTNREVLNKVLWRVLQPVAFKQHSSTKMVYYDFPV